MKNLHPVQKQFKSSQIRTALHHTQITSKSVQTVIREWVFQVRNWMQWKQSRKFLKTPVLASPLHQSLLWNSRKENPELPEGLLRPRLLSNFSVPPRKLLTGRRGGKKGVNLTTEKQPPEGVHKANVQLRRGQLQALCPKSFFCFKHWHVQDDF